MKNRKFGLVFSILLLTFLVSGFVIASQFKSNSLSPQDKLSRKEAERLIKDLKPIHEVINKPQPGDWLDRHKEPGQTFAQFIRSDPVRPDKVRHTLYVVPIGEFTEKQKDVFDLTCQFLKLYFGTPVKILDEIDPDNFPAKAKRTHPSWGDEQILSTYVLNSVLQPKLPDDGWALLGLTSSDLWPGDGWNFVFGQASLRNRVGVWSIYRNGNPSESEEAFKLCLKRTLQTATHETGHMLSINHCIFYECNMCGANSQSESDRRPVYLCPICTAKITWATKTNPLDRAKLLQEFCETNGLTDAAKYYKSSIEIMEK